MYKTANRTASNRKIRMLYSRIHDTSPTRKSRTLRKARYVYGDGDAKNRYVYCQYCGFICDTQRDILQPTSGVSISTSVMLIGCENGTILMDEATSLELFIEQRETGSYTITHNCPFCGGQYTL
jgi:hypothetical protein